MQGKVNVYGALPKVSRLRSRIEKPSKDLTSQIRAFFQDAAIEVLNSSKMEIRAKMIQKVASLKLQYKNKQHEAQVFNLMNDIFDSVFASTNAELRAIVGVDDDSEDTTPEETPEGPASEENPEGPAEDPKPKKAAEKTSKKDSAKEKKDEDPDDFSE